MNKKYNSVVASFFLLPSLIFSNYSNASQTTSNQVKPTTSLEGKLNQPKLENSVTCSSLLSKIKQNIGSEESASFYIHVNKKNLTFSLFQKYNGEDTLLLENPVALGMRGFSTPLGNFYLRRIVNFPIWFPPKWANTEKIPFAGKNNPYGLWMSELFTTDKKGEYEPWLPDDSMIRIHSTNKPSSIGKYASHGCVRINPSVAENLFPVLLYPIPHKEGKKTSKGVIYPLEKTIPVIIK